jgi:hypothetical protein
MQKNPYLVWSDECSKSFEVHKQVFTTTTVLRHFDYNHEIIVETDASDYVSTTALSQYNNYVILYPVAFFFKTYTLAECN